MIEISEEEQEQYNNAAASSSSNNEELSEEHQAITSIIKLIAHATRSIETTKKGYKLHFFDGLDLEKLLAACGLDHLKRQHGFGKKHYIEITLKSLPLKTHENVWLYVYLLRMIKGKDPLTRSKNGALGDLLSILPQEFHEEFFINLPDQVVNTLITEVGILGRSALHVAATTSSDSGFIILFNKVSKPLLQEIAFKSIGNYGSNLLYFAVEHQPWDAFMLLIYRVIGHEKFSKATFGIQTSIISQYSVDALKAFHTACDDHTELLNSAHSGGSDTDYSGNQHSRAAASTSSANAPPSTPALNLTPFLLMFANKLTAPIVASDQHHYTLHVSKSISNGPYIFSQTGYTTTDDGYDLKIHHEHNPSLFKLLHPYLKILTHLERIKRKEKYTTLQHFLLNLPEEHCIRFIKQLPQKTITALAFETNNNYENALHIVAWKSSGKVLLALYAALHPDTRHNLAFTIDKDKFNLLHITARHQTDNNTLKTLIDILKPFPNFPKAAFRINTEKDNLLHISVSNQSEEVCLYLIDILHKKPGFFKAILAEDGDGHSVLHLAIKQGYDKVVNRLSALLLATDQSSLCKTLKLKAQTASTSTLFQPSAASNSANNASATGGDGNISLQSPILRHKN